MATPDPNAKFQAVFPGLPPDTPPEMKEQIRQRLVDGFKLPPEKADELLGRQNVMLRANMDFATAQDFANRFRAAGITVLVLPMAAGQPQAPPAGEIVTCPGCGRKNRVKSREMLATAKCSVCSASLAGPPRAAPAAAPPPQPAPAPAPAPPPPAAPAAPPPPPPPTAVPDVVACPMCHAKNRVKSAEALPTAKCAICSEKLQMDCPKCSQPIPVETNVKATCAACGWVSPRTPEQALAFREEKKREKELAKLATMAADQIEVVSEPAARPTAAPQPTPAPAAPPAAAAQPAAAAKPAGAPLPAAAVRRLEDAPDALPEFLWNGLREDLKPRVKCLKLA